MSVAVLHLGLIAVFAVCATASMVFSVLAERRGRTSARGLRWLGVVCAVLAGLAYALPMASL